MMRKGPLILLCSISFGPLLFILRLTTVESASSSPRVHLEPGLQLAGFGSIRSLQNFPGLRLNHFDRQLTRLAAIVHGLQEQQTTSLGSFVFVHQGGEVSHVFIRLLQQVLTMSLLILSFSILSVSFFCSLSVLVCQVAMDLVSFCIFPEIE
ncbi:hypothetical protein F7725_013201, partial [Dissostichus mawsoni]